MKIVPLLLTILSASCLCAQQGWRLETAQAGWAARSEHNAVSFLGRLWVLNGTGGGSVGTRLDSWSSGNGNSWMLEDPSTPMARSRGAVVTFNSRMWVLGGDGVGNDIWSSSDGVNWVQESAAAPWLSREGHAATVFNGRMWVMGGLADDGQGHLLVNDVWWSDDGVQWTQAVAAAAWLKRTFHRVEVFNGRMWLLGGYNPSVSVSNEVWSSPDGINWTLEVAAAPWGERAGYGTAVYNNKLRVIGGLDSTFTSLTDVWSSTDGVQWVRETVFAPWVGRHGTATVVFAGRLWILGGQNAVDGMKNDVWSYGFHLTPTTLPGGIEHNPYYAEFQAKEGTGPYTWTLTSGTPPPGLTLGVSTTEFLSISGKPTTIGQFVFTIKVMDSAGHEDEQVITITVSSQPKFQTSASNSSGCAAAPGNLPAAPLAAGAAMALFALVRRRRGDCRR